MSTITQPTTIAAGDTLTTAGLAISDSAGSGALTVTGTGAHVTNTGTFVVGAGGFGSMLVTNTGAVQTSGGLTAIAGATGTDGSNVSVDGNGSSWQVSGALDVGQAAAGSMAISAGGSVSAGQTDIGVQAGAAGIVSVVGNGSTFAAGSSLIVGDAASAELSILGGATVSATNADVGLNATGTGNIDIEGAGSELSLSGNLDLGDAGTGVLTLGNNTTLQVGGNLNIGANGVLNQFGGTIDPSVVNNTGRAGGKGSISASVSIANSGTLFAAGGTETLTAPIITGTGVLEIDNNGDLVVNVGSVVTTQTVTFTDGTGLLTVDDLGGFAATIGDIIAGDSIVVQGTSIASLSFNASTHVLTLFDPSQATAGVLKFGTSVTNESLISVNGLTPCFVKGTRISTERGEVAVEDLQVGDRVQVVHGGRAERVVWLGHRTVNCAHHPEPQKVWPVRVAAHAFGPGRPSHDLWLSPDHAVYVGDVLIPVKYLINGGSITQVPMDEVSYYHVELPQHSVLLAEGLPAESYLDTGDRANFANGSGPAELHPDFPTRAWDAAGCAPLVVAGSGLDAARIWVNAVAPAPLTSRESCQAVA